MKALSVKQPWAELIASGRKTIELRTWGTSHRGPLLICASRKVDEAALIRHGFKPGKLPVGVAVAVVDVVGCRPATAIDTQRACHPAAGFMAWELASPARVEHFQVKGRLHLFDVPIWPDQSSKSTMRRPRG